MSSPPKCEITEYVLSSFLTLAPHIMTSTSRYALNIIVAYLNWLPSIEKYNSANKVEFVEYYSEYGQALKYQELWMAWDFFLLVNY